MLTWCVVYVDLGRGPPAELIFIGQSEAWCRRAAVRLNGRCLWEGIMDGYYKAEALHPAELPPPEPLAGREATV